jgi:hypothetical protein
LVLLAAIFAGVALPILPVQILWINMTTAILLGLMLAFEPKERDIMRREPRDPRQPILTSELIMRILLVSLIGRSGHADVANDVYVRAPDEPSFPHGADRLGRVVAHSAHRAGYLCNSR